MADSSAEQNDDFEERWQPRLYRIVRTYFDSNKAPEVIQRGVTLDEAKAHCSDPATSFQVGPPSGWWFDGYDDE